MYNSLINKLLTLPILIIIPVILLIVGGGSLLIKNQQVEKPEIKVTNTPTQILTPIASPSATPSPTVSIKKKPLFTPTPTSTPIPTPARVSVLLVNDGTTVYCLSEWADEVKRASQVVKDTEELLNKSKDCSNSCSTAYENGTKDCFIKYPKLSETTFTLGQKECINKVDTERTSCFDNCHRLSSEKSSDPTEIAKSMFNSKKFLQETKGEHCIDSK